MLTARSRELGVILRPGHRVASLGARDRIRAGRGRRIAPVCDSSSAWRNARASRDPGHRRASRCRARGATGQGTDWRAFRHHVTPTVPALVALMLDERCFHAALSGLSQEVEIQTLVEGAAG